MTPTYNLSVNKSEVNEGDLVIVTLTTTNVPSGTKVYWEMIGDNIAPYDFLPRTLRGRFVIDSDGKSTYSFQTDRDWKTEGIEYLTFKLRRIQDTAVVIKILDTSAAKLNASLTVNKNTITSPTDLEFRLQVNGVKQGTEYLWNIEGLTNSKIEPPVIQGSFKTDVTGLAIYNLKVTKLVSNEFILFNIPALNLSRKVIFDAPVTYTLTANKTSVVEGEDVIFSLSVTNVQQGAKIPWTISGIKSSDIIGSNLTGSFTIDENGKATKTISIAVTYSLDFRNLKLSLDNDPNVSVNVEIQSQQTVVISRDASYINLLTLFTAQYGQPTATTKAVFIVNSGVNLISSSVFTQAIYSDFWPAGSTREIRVMNGAMISGRGGDAGQCSLIAGNSNTSVSATAPTNGRNGGTAIKAETGSPIMVNNYGGLVAGGGGGGGGQGGYQYFNSGNWTASVWWMGAGGGAPYGNEFLNANTWNHMVKYYGAPELNTDAYGGNAFKWQANGDLSYYNGSGYVSVGNIARPAGLSGVLSGRILGAVDANGMAYMGRPGVFWPFDRKQIRMAKPGSLKTGGQSGSCSVTETTSVPHFVNYADSQAEIDTLLNYYCGGRGGDVGENGQDAPALTPRIRPTSSTDYTNMSTSEQNAYQVAVVAGAAGGLAGYIYEGPVTIVNHDSGQTKGRIP